MILNLHNFAFFSLAKLIDLLDIIIGDFLEAFLTAVKIIFGDHFFFFKFTQIPDAFPANVADGYAGFFCSDSDYFDQFFPSFFGGSWQNQPDILSVTVGVKPRSDFRIAFSIFFNEDGS